MIMYERYRAAVVLTLIAAVWGILSADANAARIKNLCEVQGARGNALKGVGLIVGLAGTGDKKTNVTPRARQTMLRRMGVDVGDVPDVVSSKNNVATVVVTAIVPAFAKEGTRIDVQVSALYDAQSLEGGTLLDTHLMGVDGEVYALAQGSISVGGFNVSGGGGSSVTKNHVTAGRIPMGAFVEREIPSTITDGERLLLLLKRPDFGTAHNIQMAINEELDGPCALALGAGTVRVMIPKSQRPYLVHFIAELLDIDVESDARSRVVINERTGTLVVGGDVRVMPCHVAHGSLKIRITATPLVSQPLPFSGGFTSETEVIDLEVEEEDAFLMPLQGASAADVAEGLNRLMVTPRDLISIFQALRAAGVMDADLEIM